MITAVHHMALIVGSEYDLEFYKLLGRKVRKNDTVVLMDGHEIQLEVFVDPKHPQRPDPEPVGLRHFALKVSGTLEEEIERLRNESKEALEFSSINKDWTGTRFCFVKDYEGMLIELRES